MSTGPLPDRIGPCSARRQVVQHEQAARRQEVDHDLPVLVGGALEVAGVVEDEIEWRTRREKVLPRADEQLDVRERLEPRRRDCGALGIALDVTT